MHCYSVCLIVIFAISIMMQPSFAQMSIDCTPPSKDSRYELILNCIDSINVKKEAMEVMYQDFNSFAKSFDDAKVSNLREEGSITYATLEIPLPIVSDLKSEIKFTKSSNYVLEFLDGKLGGSKLDIGVTEIDGTDRSEIYFKFLIKEIPCWWIVGCANADHFEFALDKGLYELEPLAKQIQEKLDKETKGTNPAPKVTQTSTTQSTEKVKQASTETTKTELKGPPTIDTDNDGIADEDDYCKFDKEIFNGYQDDDGCPDTKPAAPKITPKTVTNDIDGDGISDDEDTCKFKPEVYNGYIDWDGCPDNETGPIVNKLDDDSDGVSNHLDQCPSMREVYNGFLDDDGCPDAILESERPKPRIPEWIKNNAAWWSEGVISNNDFATGIEFMIKENIITIPSISSKKEMASVSVEKMPEWIQKNARWWSEGKISDDDFSKGVEYMIREGIIRI